jgi:methionyl-tRNA synthetase
MDGAKMSKSIGNVISPRDIVSEYGESALRYYLLRNGRLDADADFSREQVVKTINGELVNQLGNLVSRAFNPKFLNQQTGNLGIPDPRLTEKISNICAESATLFDAHNFSGGLEKLQLVLHEANRIFSEKKPWELAKLGQWQAIGELIGNVAYAMSAYCIMVQPIIPKTATQILNMIGIDRKHRYYSMLEQRTINTSKPQCSTEQLFPRLYKL